MITFDRAALRLGDPERVVLQPTTLELREHRIALIGANGSGKSTLAKLINGLLLPTSGTVSLHVDETTVLDTRRDGRAVRTRVGFLFAHPGAQLVMPTAAEDIALSLSRTHRRSADRRSAALEVLDRYGLADRADQSVHTLSGGQQQLLAIAGILAVEPAILVADEPTTLLDLHNSQMIASLLFGLPQQLILATHDLELAARCERALVLSDGAIVFDGDAAAAVAHYRAHA